MSDLLACMCVNHMVTVPREAEDGIESPRRGVDRLVSCRVDAGTPAKIS